jgi:hypothetical protein
MTLNSQQKSVGAYVSTDDYRIWNKVKMKEMPKLDWGGDRKSGI